MRAPRLLLLLALGCNARDCKEGSVATRHLEARGEVTVQEHVTGDTVGQGAVPAALGDEEAAALAALGYMDEGDEITEERAVGTGLYDEQRASSGLNFYSLGSGPRGLLVDMNGVEVHSWQYAIADAWPGLDHPGIREKKTPWRRAQLLDNGDVIAIWSGFGIVRIDAASQLVWAHWLPVHHDLHVYGDGSVVTLTAHTAERPALSDEPIVEDRLTWLSPDGFPQRSVSVLDALMAHPEWGRLWRRRTDRKTNDVLHTNTVFVLERDHTDTHPEFKAGRILVSMRALSALALIDPDSGEAVWVHKGVYKRQHDPQITPDGRLWVFDNQGARGERSRMLRYDLAQSTIDRRWAGSEAHPFYTRTCGHAQQLPEGNLLVVSSKQGKVFELTPDNEVVWTYVVPDELLSKNGTSHIARLYEFQRIPQDAVGDWIRGPVEAGD